MLDYIEQEANTTYTENGAVTHRTTGSDCLDLFATIGALRNAEDTEILHRFYRAYIEDPDSAMKILFFARDIREGLGERRIFRTILHDLADHAPQSVLKNLDFIASYGRYDDLYALVDTKCETEMFTLLKNQFDKDMEALRKDESVSLLGKWLPSVNASNKRTVQLGRRTASAFCMGEPSYRKACTALRRKIRILENDLREKNYTFDYEKQPGRALFKYRAAFYRNDEDRYSDFLCRVNSGHAHMHADNIAPYELLDPFFSMDEWGNREGFMKTLSEEEKNTLNATWASLPDYGNKENALAIVDTSGSMYLGRHPLPASVALSLGLYFAEHNTGLFKDRFIEFSSHPQLIHIKGETFADKVHYVSTFNTIADTNLEAVFRLILRAAVKNNVPQAELPTRLIILSDMEFNQCVQNASSTVFENAKRSYEAHGYTLPSIVFWNVSSRNRQQPVTMNEQNVALFSGVTPHLFEMMESGTLSPYAFMMDTLQKERYAKITA